MRKKTTEDKQAPVQPSISQEQCDELSPSTPTQAAAKRRKVDVASLPVTAQLSDAPVTAYDIAEYRAVLRRCWIAVWESLAAVKKKP